MQRFFSAFPDGAPGLGLLLLRALAGVTLLVRGARFVDVLPDAIALAAGFLLLVGFMTPIAAALAIVSAPLQLEQSVLAASLLLLGPGALSIDARLFGRREITIPD